MYTKGPSTVQVFVSNTSGSLHRMIKTTFLKYAIEAAAFPISHRSRKSQEFCQEAVVWKRMVHPNIVPLLGITTSPLYQMISDWMPGEDLPEYVKKYPGADLRGLVCIPPVGFVTH